MRHHLRRRIATIGAVLALAVSPVLIGSSASATANAECRGTAYRAIDGALWYSPSSQWETRPGVPLSCWMKRGSDGASTISFNYNQITSSSVWALQASLKYCYGYSTLGLDASFGPATQSALKAVQTRLGIKNDGMYGDQTRAQLRLPPLDASGNLVPNKGCELPNWVFRGL